MRIAYFATSEFPSKAANTIHIMKMCQAFSRNGHEVCLFIPKTRNQDQGEIHSYYDSRFKFPIEMVPVPNIKGATVIFSILLVFKVIRFNPQFIISRAFLPALVSLLLKNPTAYESHFPIEYSGQVRKFIFPLMIRSKYFKSLIVITHSLKTWYLSKFPMLEEKILVAPDGADLPLQGEHQEDSFCLKTNTRNFKIGYVGHLYRGKGMEIITQIARRTPSMEFHVVGGLEKDLNYWKSLESLPSNIYFYGFVFHSQTYSFMKSMDLLIAPNLPFTTAYGGDRKSLNIAPWTSPLKIFEYMSSGRPMIASKIDSLEEVLKHGRNSYLCSPSSIQEWVEGIELLRNDFSLREKLAQNAYSDLENKFSWEERANTVVSFMCRK